MTSGTKKIVALSIAITVSLILFSFGLSFPLIPYRITGDANAYIEIANGLTNFPAALNFTGDRTVGFPLFESVIGKFVSLFSQDALTWVNAICIAMLITHLVTAWFLSRWARNTNLVQTENMFYALFIFFATYPALIGNTTAPITDTFAADLIVCAFLSMQAALTVNSVYRAFLLAGLSAFFFGFSILVRPGSQLAVAVALLAGIALSLLSARRKTAVICAIALGCVLVLMPYVYNCTHKYGSICLQSPATFDAVSSAQSGLRGARTLWQDKNKLAPGQWAPILPDATMVSNYYQRCQLKTIAGFDDSSLTGCLVTRPLAIPAFAIKKWIGLFDHFQFTPYLEVDTPFWLRWLSRAYDSLAWVGLSLLFMTLFLATNRRYRPEIREKLITPITPVLLVVYSVVMLAQQTAMHVENRYGFPVIPLCAVTLAVYGEKLIHGDRSSGYLRAAPLALYCIAAWTAFVAQIIIWDNTAFY